MVLTPIPADEHAAEWAETANPQDKPKFILRLFIGETRTAR
jgi:hypothetical protein